MEVLKRLGNIQLVLNVITSLCVLGIFGLLILNIISRRYALGLTKLNGYAQVLMVWMVFLRMGQEASTNEHIHINYFYKKFSFDRQHTIGRFVLIANIVALSVMFISGIIAIEATWNAQMSVADLPLRLLYIPFVVGVGLSLLVYAQQLREGSLIQSSKPTS